MFNAVCAQHNPNDVSGIWPAHFAGVISPSAISYQTGPREALARQILIFENAPSINKSSPGKAYMLVELADGRVFFFSTSMAVLGAGESQDTLLNELTRLPEWIANWKGASEMVGFAIGAALEFVDDDPSKLESWNVQGWKQYTASRLVINRTTSTIRQISTITIEAEKQLEIALSEQIKEFTQALDQSANGQHMRLHCSWQCAYNFFNPADEKKKLYRRQANQTFPLFVQQIFPYPMEELSASIIQAIDNGVPLIDFMAEFFSCPKKVIRHLNGLGIEDIGVRWKGRIKELVMILGCLDVNRLPRSRHEWTVFGESISLLSKTTKMPTTSASSRMLLGELAKLSWNRRGDISASFEERALAIERFADNVRQAIVATVWVNGGDVNQHSGAVQRLAAEASCSLGLSRLENLSRIWRAEEIRLDSASSAQSKETFPVILEEPLELGDFKIIQLISSSQLVTEGKRMSNCVGGYTGQCSRGKAFIFSVRDKLDNPCVTVEYQLRPSLGSLPVFLLVQNRGRDNETPDIKYDGALHLLKTFVQSTHIRKKFVELLMYQIAVAKGGTVLATRYVRSLEFIKFLEQEIPGRIDLQRLAEEAVNLKRDRPSIPDTIECSFERS
jgi:hypothetical protein